MPVGHETPGRPSWRQIEAPAPETEQSGQVTTVWVPLAARSPGDAPHLRRAPGSHFRYDWTKSPEEVLELAKQDCLELPEELQPLKLRKAMGLHIT